MPKNKYDSPEVFAQKVKAVTNEVAELLIAKNKSYGNSALDPLRCFYRGSALDAIKVRIDDKLSRIMRGNDYGEEDVVKDLLGYLVLYKIAKDVEKNNDK